MVVLILGYALPHYNSISFNFFERQNFLKNYTGYVDIKIYYYSKISI